ncbi:MAG: bifunctional DNA-formamidopyrimidine glycosylase/DNA-(apurinic or apyrimidinic site) lyase [Patescibacteria group bacterium]
MPELPEVENLRRGLEKSILGQKILKVIVNKPKLVSGKGTIRTASKKKREEFIRGLKGEHFVSVERRAKNLIFKLSHNKIILAHLKMTGQFVYKSSSGKNKIIGGHPIEISEKTLPNKHTHIIFKLANGTLYYNDTRMFGYLLYYPTTSAFEKENHFELLGKEPLDKSFTVKYFQGSLKNRRSRIKTVLMGQEVVTGVGNIYTDESLFESGIDPRRNASTLKQSEVKKLHGKIVSIMKRAIKTGGSSVATYRLLDESMGNYAREHKVYGKAGKACVRCKKPLEKILINNRATVFCPHCQK